jgi:hypothetical protein
VEFQDGHSLTGRVYEGIQLPLSLLWLLPPWSEGGGDI